MPAVAPDSPHKSPPPRTALVRRVMFVSALLSGSATVGLGLGLGVFDGTEVEPIEPPSSSFAPSGHAQSALASVAERGPMTVSAKNVGEVTVRERVTRSAEPQDDHSPTISDSLLGYTLFDFEKNAGTVELVLAHPLFNPKKIALSAAARRELEALLEDIEKDVKTVERPMNDRRHEVLVARWRQGALAAAPRNENGDAQPPKSADPEVETGLCGSNGSTYSYALKWGDDVALDQRRLAVYETKQRAVDRLVAFVASHAP